MLDAIVRFKKILYSLPSSVTELRVGFSGGLDSSVLMHLLTQIKPKQRVLAVHINHGLQLDALNWQLHCQKVCKTLDIPLRIDHAQQAIHRYQTEGKSLEMAAREARYHSLFQGSGPTVCILTAHHLEDQAETFFLQALRGSGIRGLGSMHFIRKKNQAYHARPLLSWSREECLLYAKQHKLLWVEDKSNQDLTFKRNFVRHRVLPLLKSEWPKTSQLVVRAAQHCAEADALSAEIAAADLTDCLIHPWKLSIERLNRLSPLRHRNTLRHWLYTCVGYQIHTYHFEQLKQLLEDSSQNKSMFISQQMFLTRYDNSLFLRHSKSTLDVSNTSLQWNLKDSIELPTGDRLEAVICRGKGLIVSKIPEITPVTIRFRQGGERFFPSGRSGSHPLKKLFQEWKVPPWNRYRWPLLYHQQTLINVPDYGVANGYTAKTNEQGLWIKVIPSSSVAF